MAIMKLTFLVLTFSVLSANSASLSDLFSAKSMEEFCSKANIKTSKNSWAYSRPIFTYDGENIYGSIRDQLDGNTRYRVYQITTEGLHFIYETEKSNEKIVDLFIEDNNLYILHEYKVIKIDLEGKEEAKNILESEDRLVSLERGEFGMFFVNVHRKGLGIVDTELQALVSTQNHLKDQPGKHRSTPHSLVQNDDHLFVGYNGLTLSNKKSRAFSGLVILDKNTGEEVNKHEYVYKDSGVLVREYTALSKDYVLINNGGHLHKLNLEDVLTRPEARYEWVPFKKFIEGYYRFGMLVGQILTDNETVYGCADFMYQKHHNQEIKLKTLPVSIEI